MFIKHTIAFILLQQFWMQSKYLVSITHLVALVNQQFLYLSYTWWPREFAEPILWWWLDLWAWRSELDFLLVEGFIDFYYGFMAYRGTSTAHKWIAEKLCDHHVLTAKCLWSERVWNQVHMTAKCAIACQTSYGKSRRNDEDECLL